MMLPMVCFTTASNGIFAALIIAAYLFSGHGVTDTFILNVFFLYFDHIHIDGDFDEDRICRRVANVSRGCIDENGYDFGDAATSYK